MQGTKKFDAAVVRRATEADVRALGELRWEFKEGGGSNEDRAAFVTRYRAHFSQNPALHWVVEDDGSVIGMATLRLAAKEPSPGKRHDAIGYLTNVYIKPQYRGRGRGTELLYALIDDARSGPVELLIVWPSEESRLLYRRLGFSGQSDPLELMLVEDGG